MRNVSLRRHRGKFVAVWYDEAGHRQRRSLGTDDRAAAQTALAALLAHLTAQAPAGPLTVGAIYKAYAEDRRSEGKPTKRILQAWKRLEPTYDHIRPVDVTKDVTRAYMASRVEVGPGTILVELTYLRAALAFAVREKWLTAAPYIPVPHKPSPKEHHLTRDEARRLLDAATAPHLKLFIRLALATAGRCSALLQLTWVRVDLDARRIFLRDPERQETRKGRATVPINDTLYDALVEARAAALTPFVIEWGAKPVENVRKGLNAAARKAGIKCSPHMLRHSSAVWMAEQGVAMDVIAQYLGHDDVRTTFRVYARFSPSFLQEAARAVNL